MKRIIIDIDGVIATKVHADEYDKAEPIKENIAKANRLYEEGHHITYYTARGSGTGKDWMGLTIRQLKSWGVKYNSVKVGKPEYDVWIDDKCKEVKDGVWPTFQLL